jgi:hypothetical protein
MARHPPRCATPPSTDPPSIPTTALARLHRAWLCSPAPWAAFPNLLPNHSRMGGQTPGGAGPDVHHAYKTSESLTPRSSAPRPEGRRIPFAFRPSHPPPPARPLHREIKPKRPFAHLPPSATQVPPSAPICPLSATTRTAYHPQGSPATICPATSAWCRLVNLSPYPLPSANCLLPSACCRLSSSFRRPSSVVCRPRSAVRRLPSPLHSLPLPYILPPLGPFGRQTLSRRPPRPRTRGEMNVFADWCVINLPAPVRALRRAPGPSRKGRIH